MADNRCVAIKASDGERCTRRFTNGTRCNMHNKFVETHGPNRTEVLECTYRVKKQINELSAWRAGQIAALGPNPWLNQRDAFILIDREYTTRVRVIHGEQATQVQTIAARQLADIARTGINPDAVQEQRLRDQRARLVEQRRIRLEQWRLEQEELIRNHRAEQRNNPVQPVMRGGLAGFANDRQNVHTTTAVKQTVDVINKILKIEVPSEYRWNMNTVSKTMAEIISECELSPASAWQMVSKYCSDESIYDMQAGIYGKVLDCVWQYIKTSPDKEDLKKILKAEMKDNIGMCAQGNLSRLTNILAGYVDIVVVEESMNDKLGRLLPVLMAITDIPERLTAAVRVFTEVGLPEDKWASWAYGLIIDQDDDDYREIHVHDGTIEFIVFA